MSSEKNDDEPAGKTAEEDRREPSGPSGDTRRAVELLEALAELRGITRGEIDAELGAGRSYSSQLFTHRFSPKLERILEILDVLDVEPAQFFRMLYPDPAERLYAGPFDRFLRRLPATQRARRKIERLLDVAAVPRPEEELTEKIEELIDRALAERLPPADQPKRPRSPKRPAKGKRRSGG